MGQNKWYHFGQEHHPFWSVVGIGMFTGGTIWVLRFFLMETPGSSQTKGGLVGFLQAGTDSTTSILVEILVGIGMFTGGTIRLLTHSQMVFPHGNAGFIPKQKEGLWHFYNLEPTQPLPCAEMRIVLFTGGTIWLLTHTILW